MPDPKSERLAEFYRLIAARCEKSGLAPHQAQVNRELAALAPQAESAEDMQEKMKAGGYYEKPGQAVYLDKMAVLAKAAEDNGHPELAKIYRERYAEVQADYAKAFVTGYEQKVSAFNIRQNNILNAFYDIFLYWISWMTEDTYTRNSGKTASSIKECCEKLKKLETSFAATAADPYYRKHIELDDKHYAAFAAAIPGIISAGPDQVAQDTLEKEFARVWAIVGSKKSEIQAIGKREEAKSKRSVWMVIPPKDAAGEYEFTANEQEA